MITKDILKDNAALFTIDKNLFLDVFDLTVIFCFFVLELR